MEIFASAFHILEVPEGYWGRFNYSQTIGLAVLAGAVWGGFSGMLGGAAVLPMLSLIMGF